MTSQMSNGSRNGSGTKINTSMEGLMKAPTNSSFKKSKTIKMSDNESVRQELIA